MGLEETMIVAGVGFRRGVSAEEIELALERTLASLESSRAELQCIAVAARKGSEHALATVVQARKVELVLVPQHMLEAAGSRTVSRSVRSLETMNVPSVAEAAALAAAGETGRLLLPRQIHGPVTCAIAQSERAR
jgi:cobalt-precorrin 5A hydrolase